MNFLFTHDGLIGIGDCSWFVIKKWSRSRTPSIVDMAAKLVRTDGQLNFFTKGTTS